MTTSVKQEKECALPRLAARRQRSAFLLRSEKRSAVAPRLNGADQRCPLGEEFIDFYMSRSAARRSTSETLHACAGQPTGRCGASPSWISQICPMQAVSI